MTHHSLYRTATYWPPGSWESEGAKNIAVQIQAIWTTDGPERKVHLLVDVAEGGYLYDGISNESNPTTLQYAARIEKFYTYPDLRSLKQVRIAVVT